MDMETDEIELPDQGDNIIRTYDEEDYNGKGLSYELYTAMKEFEDEVAQVTYLKMKYLLPYISAILKKIDATTGYKDTYKDLLQRSVRTAIEMKSRGVKPGDIITPCSDNHLDTCVPFLAALFIGAKVASLAPTLTLNDTIHLLKQVESKMIFVSAGAEELVENALSNASLVSEIVVFGETERNTPFSDFLKPSPEEADFKPAEIKSLHNTALIFFSSGVTGMPKGICLSHLCLLSRLNQYRPPKRTGVGLCFSNLYWLSGGFSIISSTMMGSARLLSPKFEPPKLWRDIEKFGVTMLILSPNETLTLLKFGRPEGTTTPQLKFVATGGSPLSEQKILQMRNFFPDVLSMYAYGQTEVGGALTNFSRNMNDIKLMLRKTKSVGKPMRGFWYKVVDPDTEEILGPNEQGELRVKTKLVMNGYHNLDATEAYDSEGWLKTGDICYYDEDHCFYIIDRIKESFKYRNWQIAPALLEGILYEHPAVKTAVVIGVPHEEDGDLPLGLVELTEKAGDVTSDDLVNYVNERVSETQKLRAGVKFITDFPYTPTGKIKRTILKKRILAEYNLN